MWSGVRCLIQLRSQQSTVLCGNFTIIHGTNVCVGIPRLFTQYHLFQFSLILLGKILSSRGWPSCRNSPITDVGVRSSVKPTPFGLGRTPGSSKVYYKRVPVTESISVVQKVEDIRQKMERMYFEEGRVEMKLDEYTYSTAIDAVGKSGEVAESIFRRMEWLYKSGKTQISPTHGTYTAVIYAYAKQCSASSSIADSEVAKALLQKIKEACDATKKGVIAVIPSVQTRSATQLLLIHGGNVEEKGQLSDRKLCYGGCNRSMKKELNPLDQVESLTLLPLMLMQGVLTLPARFLTS